MASCPPYHSHPNDDDELLHQQLWRQGGVGPAEALLEGRHGLRGMRRVVVVGSSFDATRDCRDDDADADGGADADDDGGRLVAPASPASAPVRTGGSGVGGDRRRPPAARRLRRRRRRKVVVVSVVVVVLLLLLLLLCCRSGPLPTGDDRLGRH